MNLTGDGVMMSTEDLHHKQHVPQFHPTITTSHRGSPEDAPVFVVPSGIVAVLGAGIGVLSGTDTSNSRPATAVGSAASAGGLGLMGDADSFVPGAARVFGDQYFCTTGDLLGVRGSSLPLSGLGFDGSEPSLDGGGSADADSTTIGAADDELYDRLGGSTLRCAGVNPDAVGMTISTGALASTVVGYRTADGLDLPPRLYNM
jgi:hypothetical protein